ncbi:MAG: hypothetical protein LJE68_11705, partial [Rhodobacter sp.]|nr:hypothetical protein [Rhodobacter sp.]
MQHRLGLAILKSTMIACPTAAFAHASEQGFVLLLPTDLYTGAGVAAVALTVVAQALVPARWLGRLFRAVPVTRFSLRRLKPVTSTLSGLLLLALIWIGLSGPRDPLSNPLTLMIWTVFWIGLVAAQGLIGDLWSFVTPWSGPLRLLRRVMRLSVSLRLPRWLGFWPGVAGFLVFAYLLLADPSPADPARLARAVGLYWLFHLCMGLIFGPRWLYRGEAFTLVFHAYGRLAAFGRSGGRLCLGLPGWQIARGRPVPFAFAVLIVALLGTGSFDGLNETFWWLGRLGINPLEFPGRSAVVWQNLAGLLIANAALVTVFATAIALGLRLARAGPGVALGIRQFAPALLPIALGYHIAHFLPSLLVDGQYALVALSDPLLRGDDFLGLGDFYVSTGFFNTKATVRMIFLGQAAAVVIGHVLSVLLTHAIAVRICADPRRATFIQVPLTLFMLGYTFFGLWLL